jgi:acyl-coenzyme A synthetase/AMP-(fatty) acid ligase
LRRLPAARRLERVVKIEGKRLRCPTRAAAASHRVALHAVPLPAPLRLGAAVVPTREGAAALQRLGARAMGEALRRHLAPAFDATLLPKRFRFVKELPMSERGKVVPQALAQLFARGS